MSQNKEQQKNTDGYDKNKDLAGSIKEGFAAIRDRVSAGGLGWELKTKRKPGGKK